jgi:hypothetical protein
MTDDHAEKADRLLEIISSIYGRKEVNAKEELPFVMNKEGKVELSELLKSELDKSQHQDLKEWAIENIAHLFE